jgi:hypothetical protein
MTLPVFSQGIQMQYLLPLLVCLLAISENSAWGADRGTMPPRVFLLDGASLADARDRWQAGDATLLEGVAQLVLAADDALEAGAFSVMHKDVTPPSGDKHDYMSLAPYWWPNPDSPTGLPYVRRDGERNPEIDRVADKRELNSMVDAVETLAMAYFWTRDERYAGRACVLLDAWFIDPATRMNPHLKYGQAVRGVNDGRGIGLIETRGLARLADALGLLADSPAWTPERKREIDAWLAKFLDWMLESDHGRDERAALNNHGTYYDIQVVSLALYLNRRQLAREVLQTVGPNRIAIQVEPNGSQPLELERTRAWSYSTANLTGLMTLARLGEHVDVELWHYKTADGRSIRQALDFLATFATGGGAWPHPNIDEQPIELANPLVQLATERYPDGHYAELVKKSRFDAFAAAELWKSPLLPVRAWRD